MMSNNIDPFIDRGAKIIFASFAASLGFSILLFLGLFVLFGIETARVIISPWVTFGLAIVFVPVMFKYLK